MKENEVSNKGFSPFFPIVYGKLVITKRMFRKYLVISAAIGFVIGLTLSLLGASGVWDPFQLF